MTEKKDMEKSKITDEMRKSFREPFPNEAYSAHPTKTFLTTLKAMYVTERLNDVFGIGRWTIDIEIIERTIDYVLVQGEFKSLDYEITIPKQFGGHKTTGKNTEIADGFKSALTDCQSKISSYFEIGIDMFKGKINPPKSNKKEYKDNNLPWLNENTDDWKNVTMAIENGMLTDINQVTKYKMSKKVQEAIVKLIG